MEIVPTVGKIVVKSINTEPHQDALRAFEALLTYRGRNSSISISLPTPVQNHSSMEEVVRLELQSLIEALAELADTSANIVLPRPG